MLILASASPRRTQLLQQIGVEHRVVPADIDERRRPHESVEQCVVRLCRAKAAQVWQRLQANDAQKLAQSRVSAVLGADTVVAVDDQLLGKPRDRDHALAMLRQLSGRTHQVLSAVALMDARGLQHDLSISEVRFRALSADECAAYCSSDEPLDKAGGYAIQGRAALFIERLTGSYSGVMGLPLYETGRLLADAGLIAAAAGARS
ncbi:MAG TPA: Maf family protein [Steroidobacteraceae bacterium]|jgi:septum formation protein|nr:Maf family protein [Steroidobacteraceae bacterium]